MLRIFITHFLLLKFSDFIKENKYYNIYYMKRIFRSFSFLAKKLLDLLFR